MAAEPSSALPTPRPRRASLPAWAYARALWAGVSIIVMWLVVLFIGLFGGDFVSTGSNGFTRVPVVVFLLPFVLPATIAVARRGFTNAPGPGHGTTEESPQPQEEATSEPASLRARPV